MTLNVLTPSWKIDTHCQAYWLDACKIWFHRLIAVFHQHFSFSFLNLQVTVRVRMSTRLPRLIRISKMRYEIRSGTVLKKGTTFLRNQLMQVSEMTPQSPAPRYILLISEDAFLSLINTPLQTCYIMHYSCCPRMQTARDSRHHRVQWWLHFPISVSGFVEILDLTVKPS